MKRERCEKRNRMRRFYEDSRRETTVHFGIFILVVHLENLYSFFDNLFLDLFPKCVLHLQKENENEAKKALKMLCLCFKEEKKVMPYFESMNIAVLLRK